MSGRRGFTLLEVLIATMLFAFLMGSYYAAFHSGSLKRFSARHI